ncbi:MAG: hypothetical protein ACRDP6_00165 [Actinoallomurus sp.]
MAAALKRGQDTGEVATTATPEAQMLLMLFQGSALVSRTQPARDQLVAGIYTALDALRKH